MLKINDQLLFSAYNIDDATSSLNGITSTALTSKGNWSKFTNKQTKVFDAESLEYKYTLRNPTKPVGNASSYGCAAGLSVAVSSSDKAAAKEFVLVTGARKGITIWRVSELTTAASAKHKDQAAFVKMSKHLSALHAPKNEQAENTAEAAAHTESDESEEENNDYGNYQRTDNANKPQRWCFFLWTHTRNKNLI